ncbi:lipopolysaccharide biosynthesis protein [Flavobacterium luteum]|uniref:lipopolysaccharide biosynthesis protein n=1 Tax=Flavobacterium luteum TaxID=2026654 RepID=UPI001785D5D7|nr:lipopolysaccharide biosynthesis protein [Flavobacterium luteum]
MKQIIQTVYNKVGIKSNRTKNITKHVLISFVYKAGSILASFLMVPLIINYLEAEKYGIWLTLSSFVAWFSFFDIGMGNGLRNKFAEAKAKGELGLAQAYISTAYFTIGSISLFLSIFFFTLNNFIDWTAVFNTSSSLQMELSIIMPVVFAFFCLQLVVKLIITIYVADQHHSINDKIQLTTNVITLMLIWFLTLTSGSSLLLFAILFSVLPVIILLLLNFVAFSNTYKDFRPLFSLWRKVYLKDITGVGFKFFIIQIATLILFTTDNFLISKMFGPKEVVPYNIAFKYFSIIILGYSIVVAPFWSSFTEAFAKKDITWIKQSVKNILKLWLLVPIILLVMIVFSNFFYKTWIGDKVIVNYGLTLSMALYALLVTFSMVFVNFINGVGKIKLQLITSIISIFINIPLSILLAKYFNLGSVGVILATCFSLSYSVILRPLQFYKIINNTANGIWDK